MRIAWVTRSFLDYRVPVYAALDQLCDGQLSVIFNGNAVPDRARSKLAAAIGDRACALTGERALGARSYVHAAPNKRLRIPYQPGLVDRIRACRPDVLITDGFFQWTAAALWVRVRDRVPLVMCYERTPHTERHAGRLRTWYRRLAMRKIDAMCCSGKLCGEYARSLGAAPERMTFGHMVADVEGLRLAAEKLGKEDSEAKRRELGIHGTMFLFVGRLDHLKGMYELLDAWSSLETDMPEAASLVVIGDGPERAKQQRLAEDAGLSVHFLGCIDYDDLPAYYNLADAFILPTLVDNWSLVVPEAMACGLPIITSKYNGCWPELVTPSNGWVFDPLDHTEFVTTLASAMACREKLRAMGETSQAVVASHTPATAANAAYEACALARANSR